MDNEQEGIVLETVDLENEDNIVLPNVEEKDNKDDDVENLETDTTDGADDSEVDEEKESLKRGVNKERSLRKAAEKKNRELEERIKALEEKEKTPQKTTVEELIENGVDETIAKSIAKAIDSKHNFNKDLEKEIAEVRFENSLTKKSKEEGFSDILDYADEIKTLVDKGLTIEQSYYAVTYDKPKSKDTKSEITKQVEAKMKNNQARKEIFGNINSSSGASNQSKPKIQATAEEKGIAALCGMSVEEYIAYKNMDSVKDYSAYKAKHKK